MAANLSTALEVATATDPGMVRSHNEDSIACDAEIGLAVLADGMGGYNAGEVASGMAVETVADFLFEYDPDDLPEDGESPAAQLPDSFCLARRDLRMYPLICSS